MSNINLFIGKDGNRSVTERECDFVLKYGEEKNHKSHAEKIISNNVAVNTAEALTLKSKKEKIPTCCNCGDEHIGMCIKPRKP